MLRRLCDKINAIEADFKLTNYFHRLDITSVTKAFNVLKKFDSLALPLIRSFLNHENSAINIAAFLALCEMGYPEATMLTEYIPLPFGYNRFFRTNHGSLQPCYTLPSGLTYWQCSTCFRMTDNLWQCDECGLWDCRSCCFWCTTCPKNAVEKYTICGSCQSANKYLQRRRRIWMCAICLSKK